MPIPILQVDAFCTEPFTGNPAAVVPLSGAADPQWMQAVAEQIHLSETAFTWVEPNGARRLRWFTPAAEVDLCGHATLATAHALAELDPALRGTALEFESASGPLGTRPVDVEGATGFELRFPALPPKDCEPPAGLVSALGVTPVRVLRSRFDLLAVLEDEAAVRAVAPDLRALAAIEARGVIVTAEGAGDEDFVSRFFAPAVAVDEDPVTGSAHCVLSPFWSGELGRAALVGSQLSRRGGRVEVELDGDRVLLRGRCRTVWRGELLV